MMVRGIEDVVSILSKQQKEIKGLQIRVKQLEKENEKLLNKSSK